MDGTTDVRELESVTPETEEFDAASLMEQYLSDPSHGYKTLKYGDVIDGVIMRLDRDEILVDIGSKS
jgi:small subunit ribosomal protein S1